MADSPASGKAKRRARTSHAGADPSPECHAGRGQIAAPSRGIPMDAPDFKAPQHYINRELSFLEFNQRVLAQAFDDSVPLLERLRFLCISSSNLDEFFEIRVAGLKQLTELGGNQLAPDALSIPEQLAAIHDRATRLVAEQYRCLNELLLPALAREGAPLLERKD